MIGYNGGINMFDDLIKAQIEIEPVEKDGNNPFYKNDYASLNSTIFACKQALNNHGFAVLQPVESDVDGVYVCTTLYHSSGEKITSRMKIVPAKTNDPQAQGSAISYARRYSLKSLLCMSDADDDAEKSMARPVKQSASSPVSPTTPKPSVTSDTRPMNTTGKMCPECHAPDGFHHGTSCVMGRK